MRIVSKFKDYYDSMQMYADYTATPYYRNMLTEDLSVDFLDQKCHFANIGIGFCGKIYKILYKYDYKLERCVPCYSVKDAGIHKSYHSQYRKYFGIVESHDLFRKYSTPVFIIKPGPYRSEHSHTIFAHTTNKSKHANAYNTKGETLETYEFDRVIRKEVAYTELQSYLHFLTQEYKEEPVISDRDRASLHGFDDKSFKRI